MARSRKSKWPEESDPAFLEECFLCKRKFQFGKHIYDGRYVAAWEIILCSVCVSSNWDGIVPGTHPNLVRHFKDQGIPYKLNAKGWIDIPN